MISYIVAAFLVATGATFLLINMGLLPASNFHGVLGEWSPIVLIIVGLTLLVRRRRT